MAQPPFPRLRPLGGPGRTPQLIMTAHNRDDPPLSAREREVLALIAAGHSTHEIAGRLGITEGTVKTHVTNVYRKIRVQNRVQATRYYLDHVAPPSDG